MADTLDIANANQTYGALTEGLYIASFTFERAMAGVIGLLKSGGWRVVGDGFDDVNAFVRSLRLDKHRVVADQRQEFVERVRELQPRYRTAPSPPHWGSPRTLSTGTLPAEIGHQTSGKLRKMAMPVAEIGHVAHRTVAATLPASCSATRAKSAGKRSLRASRRWRA
jgi:hypothetical protein